MLSGIKLNSAQPAVTSENTFGESFLKQNRTSDQSSLRRLFSVSVLGGLTYLSKYFSLSFSDVEEKMDLSNKIYNLNPSTGIAIKFKKRSVRIFFLISCWVKTILSLC